MSDPLIESKQALRAQARAQVAGLSSEYRAAAAAQVVVSLSSRPEWARASSVLLFAPLPDELDVWPLVELALMAGKTVALPAFASASNGYVPRRIVDATADLIAGKFGVREPAEACVAVPLNQLDLVLVPGIAFDARGGRLGRGKGFYDRLLAGARGTKCGVAFDEQLVHAVPVGRLDIRLNCILTPTRWIET
ncbi:MAG: 5-formyltetrahydrofolate cyclo-ligase [Verrucomicrobia bacterium]|jgi:5-formyltetrahydrofolate cyclo-ligase|nr:MAG: 5-formyltetrahydrofolate cyclo-ligase [Verrucomicrobiota bacterium]